MLSNLELLVPPSILQRCALVPEGSLPTGLYHISANPDLKVMIPKIPLRTLRSEDSSFPRVCVSSSWMGCVYGHSGTLTDFETNKVPSQDWLGGYVIYRTPFKYALRPHTSLLSDVNVSDEHWLFDLGADVQSQFQTVRVGECFISAIQTDIVKDENGKKWKAKSPTFYIETTQDNFPIWLCGGEFTVVKAGWYKLQIPTYYWRRGVLNPDGMSIDRITEAEYRAAKHESVVMLSHNCSGSYAW